MPTESLLEPLEGDDPCGPDLQWDPDFMVVGQMLDSLSQGGLDAIAGEAIGGGGELDEIEERLANLCRQTRDMRLLAMRAEVRWRADGLAGFSEALEDLMALAERLPGPDDGFHPRADPDDGDLGERAAALGKLLNSVPGLVATVGWGPTEPTLQVRQESAARLRGLFGDWQARLEPAFGDDIPARDPAWQPLRGLLGALASEPEEQTEEADEGQQAPATADAWDLLQRATELMAEQERHSPALPVLRMLMRWRSKDILEIVNEQGQSGVSFEQLLDSVGNQLSES